MINGRFKQVSSKEISIQTTQSRVGNPGLPSRNCNDSRCSSWRNLRASYRAAIVSQPIGLSLRNFDDARPRERVLPRRRAQNNVSIQRTGQSRRARRARAAARPVARTFAHLLVPDLHDGRVVLSVMDQPERERLDALLRRVQVHQPFDQGALREPRHRARVSVRGRPCSGFFSVTDGDPRQSTSRITVHAYTNAYTYYTSVRSCGPETTAEAGANVRLHDDDERGTRALRRRNGMAPPAELTPRARSAPLYRLVLTATDRALCFVASSVLR